MGSESKISEVGLKDYFIFTRGFIDLSYLQL